MKSSEEMHCTDERNEVIYANKQNMEVLHKRNVERSLRVAVLIVK
jgi:hypothetical protein